MATDRRAGAANERLGVAIAALATALLMIAAAPADPTSGMAGSAGPCSEAELCGFADPEDLADLAGSRWMLVSQEAAQGESGLVALDARTGRAVRYPAFAAACLAGARGGGIGIRREGAGYRLVRVLHGAAGADASPGIDAVQIYRVTIGAGAPRIEVVGCVTAPASYFLNDAVPLPDGGFAATHMFDRAVARPLREADFLAQRPTGTVVRWSPGAGWRRLAGGEGSFPNGIEASPDGRWIVFAETYGRRVNRLASDGGRRTSVALDMQPDNVTALSGSRFVVAGGTGAPLVSTRGCPALRRPGCGFPAMAVTVDVARGRVIPIAISAGARTPGFSVGLVKSTRLFLGTAFGDRITAVHLGRRPVQLP